ncbi:MAG: hypothetical protein KatS3mg120_2802 [Erythrobacter sp.]|nr:MAG: hypothetical protein KatS3mg120_2802 [Erythrobacter sp.]
MADHSADPDWIDCRALRAAQQAADGGPAGARLNEGARAWRSALRLIDPPAETPAAPVPAPAAREADKAEAAARARAEREARAQAIAAERARKEAAAEAAARAAAEARARAAEEARQRKEAKERALAEQRARRAAEAAAKAKAAAEAKARREAEARARKEAEAAARARAAEEERRRAEAAAEARAKAEAEARARAEAEARARKAAEEKARREAEAKAKAAAREAARRAAEARAAEEARQKQEAEEAARRAAEARAAEERARAEAAEAARREAEEQARRAAEDAAAEAARQAAEREAELAARATRDVGESLRRLIREAGPISLAQFMGESNARYYASRDPLGAEGDFITAPEISQMFGELIGLWLADLWVRMKSRKHIHYVELGPGRGTLARDALGSAGRYGFAPQIHFVETSPALRRLQREAFPACHHHHDLSTLPEDAPLLIVANEFFDALPVHQLVRSADGWFERLVGLEGENFVFKAGAERMDHLVPPSWRRAAQGTMIETSPAAAALMAEIARRLKEQGGAALIIDYGARELRAGSTLQALKAHQRVDIFAHPGEADLTAHVDFELLQAVAVEHGAEVMGLQEQGEWLRQMGIDTRLEALQRRNPQARATLQRQYDRLVKDSEMGTLFKVLGLCGRRWPFGVGFA